MQIPRTGWVSERITSPEEAESLRAIAGGDLFSSKLNDAILAALDKE